MLVNILELLDFIHKKISVKCSVIIKRGEIGIEQDGLLIKISAPYKGKIWASVRYFGREELLNIINEKSDIERFCAEFNFNYKSKSSS